MSFAQALPSLPAVFAAVHHYDGSGTHAVDVVLETKNTTTTGFPYDAESFDGRLFDIKWTWVATA